jgi:hypothetical protein
MLAKLVAVMQRQFPYAPKTRRELYPILLASGSALIAMFIFVSHQPIKRTLALEALWFQFIGAALLWWESNANEAKIGLAVQELRKPTKLNRPRTSGEKILYIIALAPRVVLAIALVALFVTALAALAISGRRYDLLIITLSMLSLVGAAYGIYRFSDWYFSRVAQAIADADAGGAPKGAEQITRRALRTIGFSLIAIATLFQVYPALDLSQDLGRRSPIQPHSLEEPWPWPEEV